MKELSIDHYGAHGVHGKDIVKRGFLAGLEVREVGEDDTIPLDTPNASLVSVPIGVASKVVRKIMEQNGEDHPIIDLSGIMRSANVGIPLPFPHIHHLHCLFGPPGKGTLNAIACRGKVRNVVFEHMLNNVSRANGDFEVRIVEATPESHDVTMALVQGCAHAISTVLALKKMLPDNLLARRATTPNTTIADMILLNPKVGPLLRDMFSKSGDLARQHGKIRQDLELYLKNLGFDLTTFTTPYFNMYEESLEGIDHIDDLGEKVWELLRYSTEGLVAKIEESKK